MEIESDVIHKNIAAFQSLLGRDGGKLTVTNLFNFVYGTRSQRTEGMNWKYTKQQFYLWLRYTSEQKNEKKLFVLVSPLMM